MKLTRGKQLLFGGLAMITVPPLIFFAIYSFIVVTKADWYDLLGFAILPLTVCIVIWGVILFLAGLVVLTFNRLKSARRLGG